MTKTDTRTTFNVKIRKTRTYTGARGTTYTVRWLLDDQVFPRTFKAAAAADSFRSMLNAARGRGEAFAFVTGLPLSHPETVRALAPPAVERWTVFELAERFTAARWARASGHQRRNAAWTLTVLTTATLTAPPLRVTGTALRSAVNNWALGPDRENPPADARAVIDWVRAHSRPVADLADEQLLIDTLAAVNSKTGDGKPVARSSVHRNKTIISTCLDYAVRHRQLDRNPLDGLDPADAPPARAATPAVDKRSLPNHAQALALLDHIAAEPRSGASVGLFYRIMYYAGPRPEEVVALRVRQFIAPDAEGGWGEFVLENATPELDARWTDSGTRHDERGLKQRGIGEIRPVPVHPDLARHVVAYLAANKRRPEDYLLRGERSGQLAQSTYDRALKRARNAVLTPEQAASPLARRVYDWRHVCLTNLLNAGVPAPDVARWAGNSVPVLMAVYHGCISDTLTQLKSRLDGMYGTD